MMFRWIFIIITCLTTSIFSQRIVSLAPSVTCQMVALGADYMLVGKTSFCDGLAGTEDTKIIGDVINISGEGVLALKPDLIIAGGLTNKNLIEKFRKVGMEVFLMPDPSNYEELTENFRNIANFCGKETVADSILAVTNKKYDEILKENGALTVKRKIFIQLSTNPVYTVMKNTLGDEMITAAGGENCFSLAGGAQVSREAVVSANPDMIIIANMEEMSQHEIKKWEKFKSMKAARNNAIHIFDGYSIGSPTPVSFIETVEKIRGL